MNTLESKINYEADGVDIPVKVKPKNDERRDIVPDRARSLLSQERFWATLAHAIGPVMIAMLFWGDGPQWLGLLFITGGIYFYYSDKSPYVKHHARQALALQLLGTFGWFAVMFGLVVIGIPAYILFIIVSAILIIVLVGIVLLPIAVISWPLLMMASFAMPLGTAVLGAIAAWETWHERDYSYPRLAKWLDRKFGVCYRLV